MHLVQIKAKEFFFLYLSVSKISATKADISILYCIAGIIGEEEILANWRITKIHQIKLQSNFMTTPTNTCYIIML